MAVIAKNYLDLTGLQSYDALIKTYINTGDAKAIKTVLWDSTNEQIKFYKKENATLADTADYSISVSAADVESLKTRVGLSSTLNGYQSQTNLTDIMNVLTGDSSTAGSVAKAAADAVSTAEGYTDTEIAKLDADLDASGTAQHSGTFVVSGITEVDGKITAVDSVEVEAAGAAAALEAKLAAVAKSGDADDVAYDNTTSGLTATDVQAAIDEIKGGLGTAAAADVATSAIQEQSADDGLVSAKQVAAFVASEIAGLEGAMHFRGVVTRQSGETDAQAIARVIKDPEDGDVVVMSDNAKEYVYYDNAWHEVGDETEFVKKTTTIAGVDLQDNITKTELLTALNVEDGAEANIIESVQVNGSALTPDANKAVNVTVAEGATNGTVAVNGSDVAVHGLGSAAYTASTDYDAAGTAAAAVEALDGSAAIASVSSETITIKAGVSQTDGVVGQATGDDITISPIATASINALFS
jgi:hypothetical protein